ncbi:MAG: hypothetical protein ABWY20_15875 [Mycobacterium sp.]
MTRRLLADAHAPGTVSLLAEAATVDDVDPVRRIITGTIVPFGEQGRTNLGLRGVAAGAVRFRQATDPRVIGIYGHDRERTVSRLIAYEDTPSRLRGRFRVATTPLGDQLLAEAAEGVRAMLSIELDGVRYDPAGNIVDGLCEFVAHVPIGAYDSATVDSVAASLHTESGDDVSRRTLARARFGREFITVGGGQQPAAAAAPAAAPSAPAAAEPAAQLAATAAPAAEPVIVNQSPALDLQQLAAALAQHMTAAAAPAGLPTGGMTAAPAAAGTAQVTEPTVEHLASLQAGVASGDVTLRAALADITNSDLPIFQRPAGAIPQQLWANTGYTRRFVPLLTARALTSYKFGGWEFTQGPEVDDWSGDKDEVPTNEVATREIEGTAARLAGGWDVDRKYRDFGDSAFWSAFYAAQTESYARKSDLKAAAAIVAAAQDVTGTTPVTGYTRPTGFGTVAAQSDVLRAVAFGTAYLEETPLIEQGPDFVLMNTADYMSLLDVAQLDAPEFLSLFGVAPGSFIRTNRVPAGSIVLGVRRALEWYELPGAAPIRVEALDVARGGIDSAVYGYWGTLHVRPGGIISVPLDAG